VLLLDESRTLEGWVKDYDTYTQQFQEGTLHINNSYDRLKDIAKVLYVSPLDMSDIYLKIKPRLEIAEALKLDLKQIVTDHEFAQKQKISQLEDGGHRPYKRLRYSRVCHSLKIYEKDCQIPGIKDIESMLAKVASSTKKLEQAQTILETLKSLPRAELISSIE
jgi:hypothetical protein